MVAKIDTDLHKSLEQIINNRWGWKLEKKIKNSQPQLKILQKQSIIRLTPYHWLVATTEL